MNALARPISPDEICAFQIAGVVLLKGILDLPTVNSLRRGIDQGISTLRDSPSGYDMSAITRAFEKGDDTFLSAGRGGQHDLASLASHMQDSGQPFLFDEVVKDAKGRFFIDTGVAARIKPFRRLLLDGAIPEIAAALLASEEVRFFGDQIFVKEPGTRERTAFHQDATYFEIEGEKCCVLWIPVDPATRENGTMMYVRGSHRDGRLYRPNVFVSQTSLPGAQGEPLPDIEGHPNKYDIVHFDVEPGDVIVHHYRTIHGAGGNQSLYQVRRAASVRYCGDDIRFKTRSWAPRQLHHQHRLNDGDALHGPDFPTVWRRAVTTSGQAS